MLSHFVLPLVCDLTHPIHVDPVHCSGGNQSPVQLNGLDCVGTWVVLSCERGP